MSKPNNIPNNNFYEVKGRAKEVRDNPKFETTTADIAAFIQDDLNKITKAMRNQGMNIPDVKIKLTTESLSKQFVMAVLIMPESVLKNSKKLNDVPSVFRAPNEGNGAVIQEAIWSYIKNFVYSSKDRAMFNNPGWRHQVKFNSSKQINALNGFVRPTVVNIGGRHVCVAIDLIRVFKEMLQPRNGNREAFTAWVQDVSKIKDGNHKFIVTKCYDDKKKSTEIEESVRKTIERAIAPVYRENK